MSNPMSDTPTRSLIGLDIDQGFLFREPTRQAFDEGGYETRVTPYTGEAERDFGDAVIQLLFGLE